MPRVWARPDQAGARREPNHQPLPFSRTRFAWIALLPMLLVAASSASFGLTPARATIDPSTRIAEFRFSSLYARPRIFEVTVSPDGDAFFIVPSIFRIDPFETKLIRIARRPDAAPPASAPYTVTVTQVVPGAATPPPNARRFTAELLVLPKASGKR
jgi:P pilus assembly chaperone PapD